MSSSRWPRKLWPLALLTRLLAGCTTTSTEPERTLSEDIQGKAVQFGQWAVGCSNLRICVAVAPVRDYSSDEDQAYIEIGIADGVAAAQNMAIARNGSSIRTLSLSEGESLLQDLAKGDGPDAVLMGDETTRFDVPRHGFADVMAALKEWRSRPPSAAASTEVVTPLPATRLENAIPPPKVVSAAERCPKGHMGTSFQAWRGIGGQTLWRAGCGDEGLNSPSFWYVAGPQGAPATEVEFEGRDGPVTLYNSWYQESTGYLRSVHYFGHWESYAEDCGIYRAYAWGAEGMKLVEQRYMPQCGTGISPSGWIITYRATILNGPDSGP
jgi:hypothetical protein